MGERPSTTRLALPPEVPRTTLTLRRRRSTTSTFKHWTDADEREGMRSNDGREWVIMYRRAHVNVQTNKQQ